MGSFYFLVLGIFALSHMMSPVILKLVPSAVPVIPFHLKFTQGEGDSKEAVLDYQFTTHDLVCLGLCSVVGIWYIIKKHWLANDLLGMAFAVNGVELLHLNNVVTGCILLGGLFFYDIFWVFGTDVMVTVAKSFEAPIKLVFPQDLLENGLNAQNFAMLGLGDIVIPGIFIALLLRYDISLKRNSNFYFYATFMAYLAGLLLTIFVMHVYKHAQPALLYPAGLPGGAAPARPLSWRHQVNVSVRRSPRPRLRQEGEVGAKEDSQKYLYLGQLYLLSLHVLWSCCNGLSLFC